MTQIKTIVGLLSDTNSFDQKVNEALEDGWTLKSRKAIVPHGTDRHSTLYAELERKIIAEEEHDCVNRKHRDKNGDSFPCRKCYDADNWEPIT